MLYLGVASLGLLLCCSLFGMLLLAAMWQLARQAWIFGEPFVFVAIVALILGVAVVLI